MRIYLAGPYQLKEEIVQYRDELVAKGFEVTSRWLNETHKPDVQLSDLTDSELMFVAVQDIDDIMKSDVLVKFEGPTTRGGKYFEAGFAYGLHLPVIVVGKKENVFEYLPNMTVVADWEAAKLQIIAGDYIARGNSAYLRDRCYQGYGSGQIRL